MNYQIIDETDYKGNVVRQHIQIELQQGRFRGFPIDNSNPSYISFIRQLSQENPKDPHYLAWVEAGNTPEDFWTQDDDFLDTSLSEPSEPKEEETTEQPSSTDTKIETDLGE